ncbi:MAG: 2-polyprenyl-3-methyl-5-hydroxy-6-metoxy-1,4-benzoquinol methylase [Saprospiraceae bacterium]|jgi:2-polyprenyl-3-methyl-5-hydroxy-6-metoxy-1,4-benzoquinol methylase
MTNIRWKIAQAAEIRWWQGYLGKKPKADYLKWKKEYWQNLLKDTAVLLHPGDQVLDAGCGPAGIFMIFEDQDVDAMDPLLDQYSEKLDHFKKADYPKVNFYSEPLETFQARLPYDKVFCLNAINHVADLERCFDKLVQFVKPGGTLVVSIDAHNYWGFKKIFRLLPGDILHPHQYDLKEYQKMLTDRNCEVQKSILYKKEFFFDYYIIVARVGLTGMTE